MIEGAGTEVRHCFCQFGKQPQVRYGVGGGREGGVGGGEGGGVGGGGLEGGGGNKGLQPYVTSHSYILVLRCLVPYVV